MPAKAKPVIPPGPLLVPSSSLLDNLKIVLVSKALKAELPSIAPEELDTVFAVPDGPAVVDVGTGMLIFTPNVVCRYLALQNPSALIDADGTVFDELMEIEEAKLLPLVYSLLATSVPSQAGTFWFICMFFTM